MFEAAARAVAMTCAPASRPRWTAAPVAPPAPCMRTVCPACSPPCVHRPRHAVSPAIGRAAGGCHRALGNRRQVARFNRDELRRGAIPVPVAETDNAVTDGPAGDAVANLRDDAGEVVHRDRRCTVTSGAVRPGAGPRELIGNDSGRVDAHERVAGGRSRVPDLLPGEVLGSAATSVDPYGLHRITPLPRRRAGGSSQAARRARRRAGSRP